MIHLLQIKNIPVHLPPVILRFMKVLYTIRLFLKSLILPFGSLVLFPKGLGLQPVPH